MSSLLKKTVVCFFYCLGSKYNQHSPPTLSPFLQGGVSCLTAGMPGGEYGELGGSLPAIASLNASYSTSLSLPSPYLFVPPAERKAISDVRRTFCLFVTFDLLFISLLWIIELNVSVEFFFDHRTDGQDSI